MQWQRTCCSFAHFSAAHSNASSSMPAAIKERQKERMNAAKSRRVMAIIQRSMHTSIDTADGWARGTRVWPLDNKVRTSNAAAVSGRRKKAEQAKNSSTTNMSAETSGVPLCAYTLRLCNPSHATGNNFSPAYVRRTLIESRNMHFAAPSDRVSGSARAAPPPRHSLQRNNEPEHAILHANLLHFCVRLCTV